MQIIVWIFWGIVFVCAAQFLMPLIYAACVIIPMILTALAGLAVFGLMLFLLLAMIGWVISIF